MPSLWGDVVIPAVTGRNEAGGITCGTHFFSDVDGTITHLRLYRDTAGAGVRTLTLWDENEVELASVAGPETVAVSGWYNYALTTPVAITANTRYVVSYHNYDGTTNGRYATSDTETPLLVQYDAAPLHAYADNAGGFRNGTFIGGTTPAFPTSQSFPAGGSFYADVIFEPDTQPGVTVDLPAASYTMIMPVGTVTAEAPAGVVELTPITYRMTLHPGTVSAFDPGAGVTEVIVDVVNVSNEPHGKLTITADLKGGDNTWFGDTVIAPPERRWEVTESGETIIRLIPNANIEAVGMGQDATWYDVHVGKRVVPIVVPVSGVPVELKACHELYRDRPTSA